MASKLERPRGVRVIRALVANVPAVQILLSQCPENFQAIESFMSPLLISRFSGFLCRELRGVFEKT